MERQTATESNEPSHDFQVYAATHLLVTDGLNAQKGSKVASDGLLNTADWIKTSGLLNEVLTGLEKDGFAKISRKKDGTPSEIVFDQDIPGYRKNSVKVDLDSMEVNKKNQKQLNQEAAIERKEFVDALSTASNRPLPEGETTTLDATQKKVLQTLEESLNTGNLEAIKKSFQSSSNDAALWNRMAKEISSDFTVPEAMRVGKGPDGKPYIAIIGQIEKPDFNFEAIVIPAKGDTRTFLFGKEGEIDFNLPSPRSSADAMTAHQSHREPALEEKMTEYLCDFDAHERSEEKVIGLVSQKELVDKYNSYDEHLCSTETAD